MAVAWTPTAGTWYHVAVTWTAATSVARFYIDGVQQGTNQTGTFTSTNNPIARFTIGANPIGAGANFLDGIVDDVRVWNVIRTVTQIADNRSIELVGNESGLAAYWPFETLAGAGVSTVGWKSLLGVGQG